MFRLKAFVVCLVLAFSLAWSSIIDSKSLNVNVDIVDNLNTFSYKHPDAKVLVGEQLSPMPKELIKYVYGNRTNGKNESPIKSELT